MSHVPINFSACPTLSPNSRHWLQSVTRDIPKGTTGKYVTGRYEDLTNAPNIHIYFSISIQNKTKQGDNLGCFATRPNCFMQSIDSVISLCPANVLTLVKSRAQINIQKHQLQHSPRTISQALLPPWHHHKSNQCC